MATLVHNVRVAIGAIDMGRYGDMQTLGTLAVIVANSQIPRSEHLPLAKELTRVIKLVKEHSLHPDARATMSNIGRALNSIAEQSNARYRST